MRKVELERSLEDRCVERVEELGGLALKLKIDGVRGFPDRTIFWPGRATFCAEFKRGKGGQISAQQMEWQRRLYAVGVAVYFVDSDEDFHRALFNL